MFIAIGAGAPAIAGAHLVVHAAFKSLLFLGAGIAMHETGTGRLARMRLGRVRPVTALLSAVGLLALAAVPLTGGGWSKEANRGGRRRAVDARRRARPCLRGAHRVLRHAPRAADVGARLERRQRSFRALPASW